MSLILKIVSAIFDIDNIGVIIHTFDFANVLHYMDYWNDMFFCISFMENELV